MSAFQKVVECKREMTMTGSYRYVGVLACGCPFWKSCRWNRVRYVPDPPTRMKCRKCEAKSEART